MRTLSRERLLYAGLTFLVVFVSYVLTLAPTLTFWDAGEFIATAYSLGIPHPPGTPLFILMGHVFGMLPLGIGFAMKLNLMSALASSVGGFFYFLVLAQIIGRIDRRFAWDLPAAIQHAAAGAGVLLSAWGLTVWSNSTETEVYTVALMTIALVTFLLFYWADHQTEGKDWNLILLIVFLMGLSVGNHLMALLILPAAVVYVVNVVWPTYRDYVLSLLVGALGLYLVVMKGISVDGLIAGDRAVNPGLMLLGLIVLGVGIWWMARTGSLLLFVGAVACFVAGTTVILYLKIRAGLDPAINEANPETWRELLAVLARKQYDVRPVFPRSVELLRFQLPLYLDYLFGRVGPFDSQVSSQFGLPGLTLIVVGFAIAGSVYHCRADRASWIYFLIVYLTTSLGLLLYLNFPLGNTQALEMTGLPREVRERDYFFVVSFLFIGLWAGIGVFALLGEAWHWARRPVLRGASLVAAVAALLVLPAAVFALNRHESDRSDNWIARDFAYNVLQSVEPWGIVITNGDNDTFTLWYLQEVEGVRRDVTVVVLALLNTSWYLEQLSERTFMTTSPPEEMPAIPLMEHGVGAGPRPTETLLDYSGTPEDPLYQPGIFLDQPVALDVEGIEVSIPANSVLRRQDIAVLQLIRKNLGRRPIYFSVTVPESGKVWTHDYTVREGIVDRLHGRTGETLARAGQRVLPMQPPERSWIDIGRTALLLEEIYRYRGIGDSDIYKDGTALALIGNYGATFLQLAAAYARAGDVDPAIAALRRGNQILGRGPLEESYLTSLINVFAVSGSYDRLDSLLRSAEDNRGGRLDARYYKTAAYNSAVAGHFDVADKILETFFREDPRAVEPELWIEIAEIALARDDTTAAMELLTRAIRVDPDNRHAFLRYLNLADGIGNEMLTKTFLFQWIRTHPGDTLTARLYDEYMATGEFPARLSWDSVARAREPGDTLTGGGAGTLPGGG